MARDFEELAYHPTPMGDLILRRRRIRALEDREVHEIILGDAFLMSSLFTAVEVALSDLALAACESGRDLDVVVGGLGLGYTADAALKFPDVASVAVVETLAPVIDWHQRGLVPLGNGLSADSRCRFVRGDFFQLALSQSELWPVDAILLDIDHTPSKVLDPSHAALYTHEGLAKVSAQLRPQGVFAMWSDDPPEEAFMRDLKRVFATVVTHTVSFENPLQGGESSSTVYVAKRSL